MRDAFVAAAGAEEHSILIPAWPDLLWGTVAFVAVLLIVIWKVLPNVYKALDARTEAIQGGIAKAEAAQAEANAALAQYQEQLAAGRTEAAEIREQARKDGASIIAELKEQASAESARIIANAQSQIEAERQAAVASLKAEVGSLAIDLASGVVGQSLSDDARAGALVDQFLKDLEVSEASK